MNGRIDVIEVLRLANPVPPQSTDERNRLSTKRRAPLRVVPTDVPLTVDEADTAHPRRSWPKYAAAAVAVAATVAALVLVPRWNDRDADLATPPDTTTAPPATTAAPVPTSEVMWPQSSVEEVREAQRLADAGDPGFTWQVDPELTSGSSPLSNLELVDRFLEEELGWGEFRWRGLVDVEFDDGNYGNLVYVRCAPGRTNPLYPTDAEGGECAPTIDELRYETVSIDIAQLARQDATGVWVVTRWESIEPEEQVVPASDDEATDFLEGYLAARVAGSGDATYIVGDTAIPLRHATTAGAPYERFEIVVLGAPRWPSGERETTVQLFADGGATVVEQRFVLTVAGAGRLGLEYANPLGSTTGTTENGRFVAVPVSYDIPGGEVTFAADPPWRYALFSAYFSDNLTTLWDSSDGYFSVMVDPRPVGPDCAPGALAADAAELAVALRSDPDLQATEPVTQRIAGVDSLVVDVVAVEGATACDWWLEPLVLRDLLENAGDVSDPWISRGLPIGTGDRMRLYLIDLPDGSGRVLALAVFAPEERLSQVLANVASILDSFDFQVGGN